MQNVIEKTKNYIKNVFKNEFTGHDYYHALRVESVVNKIVDIEGGNRLVCVLSALLHDVIDDKIQDSLNPECEKFEEFFDKLEISKEDKEQILYIINNMSFSKMMNKENKIVITKELAIVSDVDKMDSVGAIGIARTFSYNAKMNRQMYNPEIPAEPNLTQEEYKNKNRKTTALNHFDEKLLKLGQYLLTKTGKEIAKPRIEFLKIFKKQFLDEWNY